MIAALVIAAGASVVLCAGLTVYELFHDAGADSNADSIPIAPIAGAATAASLVVWGIAATTWRALREDRRPAYAIVAVVGVVVALFARSADGLAAIALVVAGVAIVAVASFGAMARPRHST